MKKKISKKEKALSILKTVSASLLIFSSGIIIGTLLRNDEYETDNEDNIQELPTGREAQLIDEDIFTNVAPWIESAVLDGEGVDEEYFETAYTVTRPRYGDWDKGSYEETKKVEIIVRDETI